MTHKDYELIAAALLDAMPVATLVPAELPIVRQGWAKAAEYVAGALANQNPRFDRVRFLAAAGL